MLAAKKRSNHLITQLKRDYYIAMNCASEYLTIMIPEFNLYSIQMVLIFRCLTFRSSLDLFGNILDRFPIPKIKAQFLGKIFFLKSNLYPKMNKKYISCDLEYLYFYRKIIKGAQPKTRPKIMSRRKKC